MALAGRMFYFLFVWKNCYGNTGDFDSLDFTIDKNNRRGRRFRMVDLFWWHKSFFIVPNTNIEWNSFCFPRFICCRKCAYNLAHSINNK